MNKKILFPGLLLGLALFQGPLAAEDLAKFYGGKTLTMIVGTDAGGGYDVYARLLARHIKDFIPGNPAIAVQNMPGAGGLLAVNHVFNNAKRDGTVFAMVPASNLLDGILGNPNAKFDLASFTAIGNMNAENDNCIVWRGRGTESTDDLFKKDVITGATGQASNSYIYPALMNSVLGTRFKLVSGYPGTDRMRLMEKGEMDAACGIFTSTLQTQMGQLLDSGKIFVAIQMGLSRHPSFAGVPNAVELAKNEADHELLALAFSPLEMGRPIIAPPFIPSEKVAGLQAAFNAAMNDDSLKSEARQQRLELRWFDAKRLRQILADMSSAPESVKKRARSLLNPGQ